MTDETVPAEEIVDDTNDSGNVLHPWIKNTNTNMMVMFDQLKEFYADATLPEGVMLVPGNAGTYQRDPDSKKFRTDKTAAQAAADYFGTLTGQSYEVVLPV